MEATTVSLGKAVLDGALGYAKSLAAEELALQLGVEGDVAFITDELEMMQSFLMTADEEQDKSKVLTTWVKQVRDLAYNVEDSLMDFGVHSEKKASRSWWCIVPRNPCDRRRIAEEVKELRAKVEDVSSRNLRYRLIKESSSGSKPTAAEEQASIASAAMFGINEARLAAVEQGKSRVDLSQLIAGEEEDLRVIAVWGTTGDLGKTSTIQEVYDDPKVMAKFGFRAWIRLMHPFNPKEFLQSLVRQFYENSLDELEKAEGTTSVGANVLMKMEEMEQIDLVRAFNAQVTSNSYMIVINDLSTIEEWHCIKKFFPDNKKRSRIIVSTQQVELASLCTERPYQVSELKQLSSDQIIYLFHKKVASASGFIEPISDSNNVIITEDITIMSTEEIQEEAQQPAGRDEVPNSTARTKFVRSRTIELGDEMLTGRETEKSKVIELIGQPEDKQGCKVISVWGMGGIGKTTLIRSVYRSQQLGGWKRAWATALRPFNPEILLRDLALQLQKIIPEDPIGATDQRQKKSIATMQLRELGAELTRLLNKQKCLIVLDDLSSTMEWDLVKNCLENAERIIVTTREKYIAKHCSREDKNIYSLSSLEDDAALDLFKRKVFKDDTVHLGPEMMEQARLILKKCDGLPLAISTIGGFLATKPKIAIEWRKINDHIGAELEINPELRKISTVLMRSYDGLPYHLKSMFLYMSIFPEDHIIRRKRLVRRWIAEGYSREMYGMIAEEVGGKYFDELLDRSMILPGEGVQNNFSGNIGSCQLHDIIREICISKAREEHLVFTLEEGCCFSSTQGALRHLVISKNWKRDKDVLETMMDLSHARSLTVFGEWRSFFISNKMRFLRVLDLEGTLGLKDHHLDKIGQLLHLKYLSLRGCSSIFRLPDSLGNLNLQTLDVRGTNIFELTTAITKLRKLQYIRASDYFPLLEVSDLLLGMFAMASESCFLACFSHLASRDDEGCLLDDHTSLLFRSRMHLLRAVFLLSVGQLFWRPQLLEAVIRENVKEEIRPHFLEDFNRRDIFNISRFVTMFRENDNLHGVEAPKGIGKLKALHTLGVVNVTRGKGKTTLKELGELTRLRKLEVAGVNDKNSKQFWLAIAGHNQLQSLSVRRHTRGGQLDGCLGEELSPPKCLVSLKLHGKLVKVTEWIHQLENLSKLQLEETSLDQDTAIQALGMLPNLAVLRLRGDSIVGEQLRFQGSSFPSLVVLKLYGIRRRRNLIVDLFSYKIRSVLFEEHALPKLELLQVVRRTGVEEISGLPFLTSLKEVWLDDTSYESMQVEVQRQLAGHPNHASLKLM